jgi:hypothetical protein
MDDIDKGLEKIFDPTQQLNNNKEYIDTAKKVLGVVNFVTRLFGFPDASPIINLVLPEV